VRRRARDKAGLNGDGLEPVGLHDLRHSIVVLAFAHATVREVAELARHANPKVTLTMYAGITGEGRERRSRSSSRAGSAAQPRRAARRL